MTLIVDRKRAEAFLSASSDIDGAGSDFGFSMGAGSGVAVGCAAGVVGSGVLVAGVDVLLLTATPVIVPSYSPSPSSEPLMRL